MSLLFSTTFVQPHRVLIEAHCTVGLCSNAIVEERRDIWHCVVHGTVWCMSTSSNHVNYGDLKF